MYCVSAHSQLYLSHFQNHRLHGSFQSLPASAVFEWRSDYQADLVETKEGDLEVITNNILVMLIIAIIIIVLVIKLSNRYHNNQCSMHINTNLRIDKLSTKVVIRHPVASVGLYHHYNVKVESGKHVIFTPVFMFGVQQQVLDEMYGGPDGIPTIGKNFQKIVAFLLFRDYRDDGRVTWRRQDHCPVLHESGHHYRHHHRGHLRHHLCYHHCHYLRSWPYPHPCSSTRLHLRPNPQGHPHHLQVILTVILLLWANNPPGKAGQDKNYWRSSILSAFQCCATSYLLHSHKRTRK